MPTIRPYEDRDLEAVLDVWYRASKVGHSFLSDAFLVEERERLAQLWLPASETYVAESDSTVVGFASLVGDEVGGLFVDPDHHRQGVGRALLDHARQHRGTLEVAVFEENHLARAFYTAYGFEVVGRRTSDVEERPELLMRRRDATDRSPN